MLELGFTQCGREQEVVHPDRAALAFAVVRIGFEQRLRAQILKDDGVVGIGQDDRVGEPVDHPEQPLFLDGVLLAGVLEALHVAGAHQGGACLGAERHQPLDVGVADRLVLAQDDHADGWHVATLPCRQVELLRGAAQGDHGEARDLHLEQQVERILAQAGLRARIVNPQRQALAQGDNQRTLGLVEWDLNRLDQCVGHVQTDRSPKDSASGVIQGYHGAPVAERPRQALQHGGQRFARIDQLNDRALDRLGNNRQHGLAGGRGLRGRAAEFGDGGQECLPLNPSSARYQILDAGRSLVTSLGASSSRGVAARAGGRATGAVMPIASAYRR